MTVEANAWTDTKENRVVKQLCVHNCVGQTSLVGMALFGIIFLKAISLYGSYRRFATFCALQAKCVNALILVHSMLI